MFFAEPQPGPFGGLKLCLLSAVVNHFVQNPNQDPGAVEFCFFPGIAELPLRIESGCAVAEQELRDPRLAELDRPNQDPSGDRETRAIAAPAGRRHISLVQRARDLGEPRKRSPVGAIHNAT